MSNHLAIATVTATLSSLLHKAAEEAVPGAGVSTGRPEGVQNATPNAAINIYLYQVIPNAAWRNADLPTRRPDGTLVQRPQAALDLHYLLTFYGSDADLEPQRLLGSTVSTLHAQPVLTREMIHTRIEEAIGMAPDHYLANSDLAEQVETVKFSPLPLNLEELSKLWAVFFQTPYTLSVAYRGSVVLIESEYPVRAPLPVLTRGPGDVGVTAQPDLTPPFPTLLEVRPPNQQPSAHLGDVLTISGHHLDGDSVRLRFTNPQLTEPIEVTPLARRTAKEIKVKLPDTSDDPQAPAKWPVGFYTVAAVISRAGEPDRTTNELPLVPAPQITNVPISVARDANGDVTLALTCSPEVRSEQRASLLLGDREILSEPHPTQTNSLTFIIKKAPPGEHYVRLRVDGVESLLVNRAVKPPVFDPTQKVTIT